MLVVDESREVVPPHQLGEGDRDLLRSQPGRAESGNEVEERFGLDDRDSGHRRADRLNLLHERLGREVGDRESLREEPGRRKVARRERRCPLGQIGEPEGAPEPGEQILVESRRRRETRRVVLGHIGEEDPLEHEQGEATVPLGARDVVVGRSGVPEKGLQLAIHLRIVLANLAPMVHLPRPNPRTRRILLIAGGALGSVVALLALATIAERAIWSGKVLPGVEVAGADLGGRSESDTRAAVGKVAAELRTSAVRGRSRDRTLSLSPTILALTVDAEATVRAATEAGRSGNPIADGLGAILRRFRPDRVAPTVAYDRARLEGVLDGWTRTLRSGLVEGGLRFEGAEVIEIDPRPGDGLDRDRARDRVDGALVSTGPDRTFTLPIGPVDPEIDADAVDAAAARARRLLAGPVVIVAGDQRQTITRATLGGMLRSRPDGERLDLTVDRPALRAAITPLLAAFESPPRAAGFSVNRDGTVTVVPSRDGTVVDLRATGARILAGERVVRLVGRRQHPERDTAWARALGITRQVSTFTTNFIPGQPRVTNIETAARTLDGAVVEPGALFSLNDHLGPRTPEKGYVKAPILLRDGYGEDFGGGVSQIATTLYNAVFFGGYEDVEHAPHRFYISRYPMGREATINYPSIDVKFRNDTAHGVLIRAWYTDSSITVAFFGNNEGRVVREEAREILDEIPPTDEVIECPVDDPEKDPEDLCAGLTAGEKVEAQHGITGYNVTFTRVIEQPGRPTRRKRYTVSYPMLPVRYLVGKTPASTTTTAPRSTTTTTKPKPTPTTKP